MPTYEYDCAKCGVVEAFQKMSDAPLTKCPQCGGKRIARRISGGGGLIFKGSGFYETDYNRSQDYQSKSKGEGADASKAPGGEAGKESPSADAKPATPPAAAKPEAAKPAKEPAVAAKPAAAPAKPAKPAQSDGKS